MIKRSRVQERKQAGNVNPFLLQLYMNASFRAWAKIYKKNRDKRQKEITDGAEKFAYNSEESSEWIIKGSKKKKNPEDDWEYYVEQDIEINDSEYLEEDEEGKNLENGSQNEGDSDYDNELDSSRMLQTRRNDINIQIQMQELNNSFNIQEKTNKVFSDLHLKNITQPMSPTIPQRIGLIQQSDIAKSGSKHRSNSKDFQKTENLLLSGLDVEQRIDDSAENSYN